MGSWLGLTGGRSRLLAGVVAAVISAGGAQAQETRPWSGFYAGLHGGYLWGAGSTSLSLQPDRATWEAGSPDYGQFDGRYSQSADGFLGGAQAGYNWRSGTFVYGFETDLAYSEADDRSERTALVTDGATFPMRARSSQELDWLGTLRGRVGVLPFEDQRLLIYVTGGLAYGRVSTSHSFIDLDQMSGFVGSSSDWEAGGVVGAGFELAIGQAWTLKAEYLYYDLGDRRVGSRPYDNTVPMPPNFGMDAHYDLNGHIARLGINYRIGGY